MPASSDMSGQYLFKFNEVNGGVMFRRYARTIAAVVVCFFTWTSGGVFSLAHAAQDAVKKGQQQPMKAEGAEERFSRLTEELTAALADPKGDVEGKKKRLSAGKGEIEALDVDIRKQFAETEKRLKDAKLPAEVLERHYRFVKHYDDNLAELKGNIERVEKGGNQAELETEIEKFREQLERTKEPVRNRKLAPNKLPHHPAKPIKREPRLNKEEFERDLKKDKNAWRHEKRIMVASAGSLAGLLSSTTETQIPPHPDDLAETIEVQFTPDIKAKAQELGYDPLRIYEWVRNNIEYIPTYGSIQGADQCLRTQQGNDLDTASLLIALLRASGIHARYAYGTIEVPIDRAMSWVGGMTDPWATVELLSSAGMPVKPIVSGGAVQELQLEHAWVEAWIDYIPSRGARHKAGQGDIWIPLDASFKQHSTTSGIDLTTAAPFDTRTFINQLTAAATINESENYATRVQCTSVSQFQEPLHSGVQSYLASTQPNATMGDILGSSRLVEQTFPFLLGTLPYETIVMAGLYTEVPARLRHNVTFELVNNDSNSVNYSQNSLSFSIALPKLAGKRVTLSYSPATPVDEAVIAAFAPRAHADGTPITLNEYPSSLPAYLVQVKGELRVDGVILASGLDVNLSGFEQLTIRMQGPGLSGSSQELYIKAGEYLGIAFGTGAVSTRHLDEAKSALEQTKTRLQSEKLAGLTKDQILGSFLHASALASLAEIDYLNSLRAQVMGVAAVRRPSSSVVTLMLATTYFFGIPRSISVAGPSNAEMGYRMAIAARDGNRDRVRQYQLVSGLDASAIPAALQEYLLSSAQYPVTSVSAVKTMKTASEQSIPLYRVAPAASASTIAKLQLTDDLKQAITNDAGAGLTTITPQRNVAIGSWSGVGYHGVLPSSGDNYTNLNGPPTMVMGLPWTSNSILLGLLPGASEPPAAVSSAIVTDAFIDRLGGVVSGLGGLPSQPAAESIDLLTTSLIYDRLGSQLGCYLDLNSPVVATGACMATYLSLLCTASNTPLIADRNTRPVADAGKDRAVGIGETVTLDGSRSADADGDALSFSWRLLSVPATSTATLIGATTATSTFTADVAGSYTAELVVGDGRKMSLPATVTITAWPAVVGVPSVIGLATETAKTTVISSGLGVGAITAAQDSTSAIGTVMTQTPAAATTAGRWSAVNLVVSTGPQPDTEPPAITVGFDRSPPLYSTGTPARLTVSATDAVGVASISVAVDGTAVPVNSSEISINTTAYGPGSSHTITVIAKDISGNSATTMATFGILDPADTTPPKVSITAPAADAAVTAPVDIIGSVTDANLFEYTLAYAPAGTTAATVFARGNRSISSGVLGRLDPSLMKNGIYDIVLTAVDARGNTTVQTTRYRVTGDLKVGNFSVSLTDLSIPVAGIPITITRSYDSREKQSRDFGVGWSIDIQSVKIEKNRNLGEEWGQVSSGGQLPSYCVDPQGERYVSITLPDGRVEEFDLTVTPRCQALVPIQYPTISYTPRAGTTSTLQAKNVGQVFYSPSGVLYDMDSLEPYNPTQYSLTTADGTAYELDQNFGIRTVRDTNGNSLTYGTSGISHSSGKSISFTRDAKGRITQIIDPAGKAISYGYDLNGNLESVTDQEKNVTRYSYNTTHGLVDMIDPLGRRAVRNEYDGSGRLNAHIDAEGKRIEYNHDVQGRQEVVKDRNGNLTVYLYDENGRVLKKTDPLGKSTSFTFDAAGNKASETDPLGNTAKWTYDSKKNVLTETKIINGQNVTTSHTYNSLGKVLTTIDPQGNVTTNTYDVRGNLLTTKDPLGNISTNTYDGKGNLLTTTDALNNTTSYEYDGYDNRTKQIGPTGTVTTYSYDSRGNKIAETDARGSTTTYAYDSTGKLLKVTDALGNVTVYEYDKAGNKIAEINPLGNRTSYAYDSANRLILTTYADNTTTATGYDNEGSTASRTDQQGRVTRYTYNANKQLTRTDYADGSYQEIGYDVAGRQTTSTDAKGKTATTEYDSLGRVTKKIDADNHATTFEYDLNGNQTKQTDPNGHVTLFEYDVNNRLTKTTLPGGQTTQTAYDGAGKKTGETDAAGNTTTFAYDGLGRLASVTDALGQATSYEYDLNGNRTAIVDAKGHRATFVFDKLNRLTGKTMPNGGTESYAYDAAGRQTTKTDAKGQTIKYAYDTRGRLTTRGYPDNSSVTFSYTQTGKRSTATDSRGTTTYTYSNRDRLTNTINPDSKSIGYSYDPTGRITGITGPAGTISYTYSDSGRLTTVTDPNGKSSSYSYDPAGNRTGLAYPNGTSVSYSYDINNRLTNLSHNATVGQMAAYSYTLGATGNRTKIDESSGISREYSYDKLYRLTKEQVTDPANTQSYTNDFSYDAMGNRLNKTLTAQAVPPVISTDYSYNAADQLVTENGGTYTYDLNGSLASKTDSGGTTTYTYDYDGRMIRVVSPTGTTTYAYDVDGNRVEATTATETVKYLVDTTRGLAQILAEYRPDGTLIASYTYADDLMSMTRNGQAYWYHFDGLGSTRMLTDETGAITDIYDYDAFGNLIAKTGMTENPFLFTGQQFDANNGFYHLRARYYQPSTGRFMAVDPYEGDVYEPATLHKYLYTANDPVNMVDPSGENFYLAETMMTISFSAVLSTIAMPSYAGVLKKIKSYELYVNGKREKAGFNDFRLALRSNEAEIPGYSFIVGRDVADGHVPYTGRARISQRVPSRSAKRSSFGNYQSNIEQGDGAAIHTGRSTHRHITWGCIRMDDADFNKLFDYIDNSLKMETDKWGWYKNVYINAEPIESVADPKYRVPSKGGQQ
jgi:RHS repeat-associated protein